VSETNGQIANRESFFSGAACQRRYTTVNVPILGAVRIQSLTELERSTYEASRLDDSGQWDRESGAAAKVKLIVLCCVDSEGNRLFIESDEPKLQQIDSLVSDRLFDRCMSHCGFTDEDIEAIAKNFEETPAECSP
jgi:hypothetical protein